MYEKYINFVVSEPERLRIYENQWQTDRKLT